MSRLNLKNARKDKNMTQQAMADHLKISLRQYQKIEAGDRKGNFEIWDALEDLLSIHQRKLRQFLVPPQGLNGQADDP